MEDNFYKQKISEFCSVMLFIVVLASWITIGTIGFSLIIGRAFLQNSWEAWAFLFFNCGLLICVGVLGQLERKLFRSIKKRLKK